MLGGIDCEITQAEDAEQALAAIAKERPDLILMPTSDAATFPAIGPGVQLPRSGVTLTLWINPRCRLGSKKRIVRSLKSIMRPGSKGPTSFILTMTFFLTPSTSAYLAPLPRTPPNFSRKPVCIAAVHADGL
jgi:hypothetical protein